MSVLAHLALSMGERGATQALAYILNRQPGIVRAFVNLFGALFGAAGVTFDPGHIESERGGDGAGLPDLTVYDADGNPCVLVENKFWAGLTPAQPVCYLEKVSALVFIVPRQRVEMIWNELKTRCDNAGLNLGQDSERARVRWVAVENKTMLITDWQNVLDTLERAADGEEVRCDILQFRQLVEQLEDVEAFPVLRSDEVTNADVARRMINYIDLLNSICDRLAAQTDIVPGGGTHIERGTYKSIWRPLGWHGHGAGWLSHFALGADRAALRHCGCGCPPVSPQTRKDLMSLKTSIGRTVFKQRHGRWRPSHKGSDIKGPNFSKLCPWAKC